MTKRNAKPRPKLVLAWGGFCDDVLHRTHVSDTYCEIGEECIELAVFVNKRQAKSRYSDVRRIEIREVPVIPKKRRRKP